MPHYLAERYLVPAGDARLAPGAELVDPAGEGSARLIEVLYIPDDEICLYVFESSSAEVLRRAGEFDRVVAVGRQSVGSSVLPEGRSTF
jgi:hypothetical protein